MCFPFGTKFHQNNMLKRKRPVERDQWHEMGQSFCKTYKHAALLQFHYAQSRCSLFPPLPFYNFLTDMFSELLKGYKKVSVQASSHTCLTLQKHSYIHATEAVVRRCSMKKVFLEILQNSQENTCARVQNFIKRETLAETLRKKRIWHRWFPVNFAKFLRRPFIIEHLWWLLLIHFALTFCLNKTQ